MTGHAFSAPVRLNFTNVSKLITKGIIEQQRSAALYCALSGEIAVTCSKDILHVKCSLFISLMPPLFILIYSLKGYDGGRELSESKPYGPTVVLDSLHSASQLCRLGSKTSATAQLLQRFCTVHFRELLQRAYCSAMGVHGEFMQSRYTIINAGLILDQPGRLCRLVPHLQLDSI